MPASLMDDDGLGTPLVEAFSALEIHTLELALREVWDLLVADAKWLDRARNLFDESDFSSAIYRKFDELIGDQSKWKLHPILERLAETIEPFPVYQAHSTSHQRRRHGQPALDTIPDFFFRRHTRAGRSPMNDGLVIEAKIVDGGKHMGYYCGKGLARYVDGLYAWAMPQAIMLGYVRNTERTLPTALAQYFALDGKKKKYRLLSGPTPFPLSRSNCRMHESVHMRVKSNPTTGKPCGEIAVYHLWLKV
jgi:hypothetical protein